MRTSIGSLHHGIGGLALAPELMAAAGWRPGADADPDECMKFACGGDPQNMAGRFRCSNAGYTGAWGCSSPQCAPYCPNRQPAVVAAVEQATAAAPIAIPARITPQSIVQPLPDLTQVLQPAAPPVSCDWWQDLNRVIADHPCLAIAALAAITLPLVWRRK